VTKFYLAGPMTGIPQSNFPMFDRVTRVLRSRGHEVCSPAEMDRAMGIDPDRPETSKDIDWSDVMLADLKAILDCDGIVLLPGWENSNGARLERTVAESTGRLVYIWNSSTEKVEFTTPWTDNEIIYKMGRREWQFLDKVTS